MNILNLPATLIVNTKSRKGRKLFFQSRKLLVEKGFNLKTLSAVKNSKQLNRVLTKVAESEYKLIFIGGGDGTISESVDYFAYKNIIFALLPLGTANSFARSLGIPNGLEEAINAFATGKIKKVDLVRINDDYFANTANIGFPVTVALSISNKLKKYFGKFSYLIVGACNFFTYKTFTVTLKFDNKIIKEKVAEVLIANGSHQGGLLVAPHARVDSNKVLIKLVKGKSKFSLIKMWFFMLLGRHIDLDFIDYYESEKFELETNKRKYVNIDGEIKMKTPITITIAKDALNIVLPNK